MLFDNHRNVKFFNIWKNGKMKTNNWKYIKKLEQEIYILNQVLKLCMNFYLVRCFGFHFGATRKNGDFRWLRGFNLATLEVELKQ